MLPGREQENLLRQSFPNRFKTKLSKKDDLPTNKIKENVLRCRPDFSEIGERVRAWSLPSEAELKKYLGPVDDYLVANAEIAKRRRRTDDRRYSIQPLNSSNIRTLDSKSLSKTRSLPKYFPSKQTPLNSVRCKWCEPTELPGERKYNDSEDEKYIDDNGIYTTTVLCLTEL
jgi:hypothetical protein